MGNRHHGSDRRAIHPDRLTLVATRIPTAAPVDVSMQARTHCPTSPSVRRPGRLAAPLHHGFEEGTVDVLPIDGATLVVAQLSGEVGELTTGSATASSVTITNPSTSLSARPYPLGSEPASTTASVWSSLAAASAQRSMVSR